MCWRIQDDNFGRFEPEQSRAQTDFSRIERKTRRSHRELTVETGRFDFFPPMIDSSQQVDGECCGRLFLANQERHKLLTTRMIK